MNRHINSLKVLLLLLLAQLQMTVSGQDPGKDICRIENGKIIFKIDLKWTRNQLNKVSEQFGLDTLLLVEIIQGDADSVLQAQGWQLKIKGQESVEISRTLGSDPKSQSANNQKQSRLFLIDDNWLPLPPQPIPESAVYGVNNLSRQDCFVYKDSLGHFYLPGHENARSVFIAGSFNDWSTMQTPMQKTPGGWSITIRMKPGKYAYKYVADGRWLNDPGNRANEDDQNGGYNSIIYCYNHRFTLKGYADARKVFVAGSFNGFNPGELAMKQVGGGWELPMYLRQGTHAYKFIVDGKWMTDPENPVERPDGGGNFNSFVGIGDPVVFTLNGYQSAKNVNLAGNFNVWNPAELLMQKTSGGWELSYVLAPGNYEYKFIADGKWMTDPGNPYLTGEGDYVNSFLAVKPNHTFVLDSFPMARIVLVSGNFNNWSTTGYPMARVHNQWILPLYLKPGKTAYKFIVDGAWVLDPSNALWEENEFGSGNSVLWIDP